MGTRQSAPEFVAPEWGTIEGDAAEVRKAADVIRQAERDVAEKVRGLCNAALMRIAESEKYRGAESPLGAHFMAHRYIEHVIAEADMHKSPRLHALAWDARGLRWQIESLSPISTIEHALILMRDNARKIADEDSE